MTKSKNIQKTYPLPWTQDQLDTLRCLASEGHSPDEIAPVLGRSLKAVYKQLQLRQIPYKRRPSGFGSPKHPPPNKESSPAAKADYGYLPISQHPDWSKVRFK